MKKYVSPKVEFKGLGLKQNIAKTCWGNHGVPAPEGDYFYDYSGKGYIKFTITGKSCTLNESTVNIIYIDVPESEQGKAKSEFFLAIKNAGAESANNWNGTDTIYPDPDPSWS